MRLLFFRFSINQLPRPQFIEQNAGDLERFVRAFATTPAQVGTLFAINGQIVGLDLFHSPATISKLLSKLVRSNALDAIEANSEQKASLTRDDAARFLHLIATALGSLLPVSEKIAPSYWPITSVVAQASKVGWL
jgi:hypothetical protein